MISWRQAKDMSTIGAEQIKKPNYPDVTSGQIRFSEITSPADWAGS